MGRVYSVEFENVTIAGTSVGDQDLFYIAPADDKPCKILGIFLSQISDVGDAAEEILRLRLIRGHATVGSGGSAATPRPLNPSDTAAAFTARTNDTTLASAGTAVNIHSDAFNIRTGWMFLPPPELRPEVSQAAGVTMVLRLMAGGADPVTMSGTMYVEEAG